MKNARKLTSQELFRIAADPDGGLRALAGGAGTGAAKRNSSGKAGSAPKKRRKMSAAWQTMIAITAKARWGTRANGIAGPGEAQAEAGSP